MKKLVEQRKPLTFFLKCLNAPRRPATSFTKVHERKKFSCWGVQNKKMSQPKFIYHSQMAEKSKSQPKHKVTWLSFFSITRCPNQKQKVRQAKWPCRRSERKRRNKWMVRWKIWKAKNGFLADIWS